MQEVQLPPQVQRRALPARSGEGGRIARVLRLGLRGDEAVQVDGPERGKGKDDHRHQHEDNGLAPHFRRCRVIVSHWLGFLQKGEVGSTRLLKHRRKPFYAVSTG